MTFKIFHAALCLCLAAGILEDNRVTSSSCIQHAVRKESFRPPKLAVVVPGHGEAERTPILSRSLGHLSRSMDFSCLVFVYKNETEFPLHPADLGASQCQIVRQRGVFLEHLHLHTSEELNSMLGNPDFVLMLLDDVWLGPMALPQLEDLESFHSDYSKEALHSQLQHILMRTEPVNATTMLAMMKEYNLDVASLSMLHTPFAQARPEAGDHVGRLFKSFEFQAFFMSAESFNVLKSLIRPELASAYGYETLLQSALTLHLRREARMAQIDTMLAIHAQRPGNSTRPAEAENKLPHEEREALWEYWKKHGLQVQTRTFAKVEHGLQVAVEETQHFGQRQDWY